MNDVTIRDGDERDLESITTIQNAFISSTTVEWTDTEHSVDDRRTWLDHHRRAGYGENVASIRVHQLLGSTEVARMAQVGTNFGRWLDLVLLQRVLGETAPPPR